MTSNNIRLSETISPAFYDLHKAVKAHDYTHYSLRGGRGSCKSSEVSIEGILLIKKNPAIHGLVMRKVANTLRDSVYAQYVWTINMLGLQNEFYCKVSPMEIAYKPTGQKILFRGADDKSKIKSIKVPFGYIGFTHFEELDQFYGREEIRSILQSTMRGGNKFWNFESFNPPRTQNNWANKDILIARKDRYTSKTNYTQTPREWLGEQFFSEAELLKEVNQNAYLHEYMGEPVGVGDNVFDNIKVKDITEDEINSFDWIYRGIDWGYFPDPFAYTEMYYDITHRILYIYKEFQGLKMSNLKIQRKLEDMKLNRSNLITADSNEMKSVHDFRDWGWEIRPAKKGPGSVEAGFKWLQSLNEIVIDNKRCPCTADEFLYYEYDKDKEGNCISGYPEGQDDHHMACVRYALERVWRQRGR